MIAMTDTVGMEFELTAQQEFDRNRQPRWVILVITLLLLGLLGLFVADRLFHPERFLITEIEVHGRFNNIAGDQVKRVVESTLEGNYFSVNLLQLKQEIENVPWVFSASLRRRWPATLVVDVIETQPVARWGADEWLNFTGDVVSRYGMAPSEKTQGLPLLYGPKSEIDIVWKMFQKWSGKFASNGLSLDELRLDSSDLWHLKLSLGALSLNSNHRITSPGIASDGKPIAVTMIVDKPHSGSRIQRFINTLNQHLIAQFPEMQSIDLRYPNGFAINWRDSSESGSQPNAKSGVN